MIDESKHEDVPVKIVKENAALIDRQIVVTVDEETFRRVQKVRNGEYYTLDLTEQFYIRDASICFIFDK